MRTLCGQDVQLRRQDDVPKHLDVMILIAQLLCSNKAWSVVQSG
jgi:uncharacterized protein (DUF983 family)